ncbi:lysine--tRNA ligase [Patescibacteria group bacterium]|nr:lysine--tRNA ligase [Patescibacteria group bacterium]MBU1754990.1 lysine--tRNA ligase [Patescibacteria group bacterium]
MFWADRIAKEIQDTYTKKEGKLLVRDEKTLSGRVHVGSMRGVAIHGLVSEVLNEYGIDTEYRYEFNDFDPFDSVPSYLPAGYEEHLGKPLYTVPSPEPGFANYAEYFGAELEGVIKKAGFTPNYYRATELYHSGKMDECIKIALERVADVRRILKDVSGSVKDESWLPISVVCEKCGKIMTTRAFDFDGETVAYKCERSPDNCVPCGHEGRVAPWKGAAKLFWKIDWAAKWVVQGVGVEGGGKDHSTKGGSRDVANHIAKELFGIETPFDIPYEFFLIGGAKMSSSKGKGSSAKDISDLFPAAVFRLALIGKDIREQINFEPEGESVPRWYDWYDELAEHVREGAADDYTRLFTLAQLPENQGDLRAPWNMRFSLLSFVVQMPHMNLEEEAARAKGEALTDEEIASLHERADYAKYWLSTYAPEQYRYELQDTLPTCELSDTQKHALTLLADYMTEDRTGEEVHARLHELKTEAPISPKELFSAIYTIFLNRDSGPKAGWFLSVLPREFVEKRLREAGV